MWRNLRSKREAWREMDKNVIFNYDFYSDTTEDADEELPEINEFEIDEALGITPMKLYWSVYFGAKRLTLWPLTESHDRASRFDS